MVEGGDTLPLQVGAQEPPVEPGDLERIAGGDRVDTAIALSQHTFPEPGEADAVVLARAAEFADALAGGPLVGSLDAPLLLTACDELSAPVAAEIERLGADRAVLLGGEAALSDAVEAAVAEEVGSVERLAGADRYATALAPTLSELILVDGTDAISGEVEGELGALLDAQVERPVEEPVEDEPLP